MQGSFPPGSSSTNRQDSIWHDRGAVNEHADRQYNPARGAAPRNPSPDVQHGLHNGLRSSPRLFQFNPNVLPDRHESSTADNEPAVSLPPDAGSKYAHTEGTSTAAAYNSPLLHTTRTAQRRFKANTLHGEYDQSFHNSDREGTPAATTRPFPQTYKSSRSAKVHLVPQSNGHVYTVTASPTALKDTHATPPNRFLPQVLDLLPPVVQRLWKRRRKRSLSSDVRGFAASESHFARSTARLRLLLVICIGLSSLLYLFHPSKSPSVPPRPSKIEAGAIPDQSSKGIVPTWKWWSPQQTAASKPKRGKATSFAMPRHTFEELMALSSKYTRLDPPGIKTSEDLPSVTVIVDCIKVGDPFGTAETALLNAFLASAFAEPVRVPSIRVLISSDYYPRSKPDLYGSETGKIRLFTLSDSVKNHFATPAFLDISSNYVYLLQCPSPNQSLSTHLFSGPTHISDLIQIAGTAEYEDKALSTAGIARVQSGMQGPVVMAYGPYQKPDEDEREKAAYRQLRESRPIEIPLGELLIASSWLSALIVDSADRDTATSDGFPYGLTASMGQMLASQLHIKSWAVPLDPRFSIDALPTGLLDVARKLPEAFGWPDQTELNTKLMGSSAKIAVLITSADEAYATVWETIICSFAKDTTYSHEIRLFAGFDARDSQVYIMNCPGVEVHPLQKDALETWSPDICLMSSESRLDIRSMHLPYFELDVPRAELRHLEWLAALPLESLLNWHVPKIDLAIVTHNRPASLHRLLTSVRAAHYLGDKVNLFLNLEQTADDETRQLLEGSQWPFGDIIMRHRVVMGGLMTSIVESWYPADNDTYGVLLEDDVEVSPLFYSWLKFTILYYRYGSQAMRSKAQRLFGISLYQPKNIELRPEGRRKFDAHKLLDEVGLPSTLPYLSQIPCSWGGAYSPEHWKEFHQFLAIRLSEATLDMSEPIVPNIRSNRWPNSWKRYLIELVYLRGYSMLYPNYAGFRSLSTNHLEQGTHVREEAKAQKRRDLFEVPLLTEDDNLLDELPDSRLPSWSTLPILDFWGSIVSEAEIVERGRSTFNELELCPGADAPYINTSGEQDQVQRMTEESTVDHDAAKLLCTGHMGEQDWREWRMRIQRGANEIDANMLLEKEAHLAEREKRLEELERRLLSQS